MKKTKSLSILMCLTFIVMISSSHFGQAQSLTETKGYLYNKIGDNNPSSNEHNEVFYDMRLSKSSMEKLASRTISDADYPFTFIYCYTHYFEGLGNWGWTDYYIFDVRDIKSVKIEKKAGLSNVYDITNRKTGKYNFHTMTLNLSNHHIANKVKTTNYISDPNNKPISKVVFRLSDNVGTVDSIKKAFINMGILVGNEIGDRNTF